MRTSYAPEMERLTAKLVKIRSVCGNGTGESMMAEYIRLYFSRLSYFKKHPEHLKTFDCGNNARSTIALIKGKSPKTIILMGHIDTVDTKDYGKAERYANDIKRLPEALRKSFDLPEEVLKDLDSGEYMFGRGTLDMKAGVAAGMLMIKYFACHPDEFDGSLLLLNECDEEGNSSGVLKALDVLKEIKEKEGLEYVACLNADYATSDDNVRKVYLGTVGKLLPCFVAIGKESHVGDPFAAFDPNLLLSLINKNMTLNMKLADTDGIKQTVPPISLKQTDDKDLYTVQTALSGISYYNFMTYTSSPKEVMDKCLKVAKDSFREAIELKESNHKEYCKKNKIRYKRSGHKVRVYSYDQWNKLLNKDVSYRKEMDEYSRKLFIEDPDIDMRDYSYRMITHSYSFYEKKEPVVIVFFGSMYYSSIETKDEKLISAVKKAVNEVNESSSYDIVTDAFYPYISDMSFMSVPFKDKDIENMFRNCLYPLYYPYKTIRDINVPVVNIGTYGKDGHTYVERLEKAYSFNELPELLFRTIKHYFE